MRGLDLGGDENFPGGMNMQPQVKCSNTVILKAELLDQHRHLL